MGARPLNVILFGNSAVILSRRPTRLSDVAIDTHALTAESLGIKLTAIESVAPHYLTRHDRLDAHRTHAGR